MKIKKESNNKNYSGWKWNKKIPFTPLHYLIFIIAIVLILIILEHFVVNTNLLDNSKLIICIIALILIFAFHISHHFVDENEDKK